MELNWRTHVLTAALTVLVLSLQSSACPTDIPEPKRRDCYPEPGASPEGCAARGCLWCPADIQGTPYCFYTNSTVPECYSIPDNSKRDCHPESGSTEARCLARNCCWAASSRPGTPWCFFNSDACSIIPPSDRIDCHPEPGASPSLCRDRGCLWCEASIKNVPFCFHDSKQNSTSCSDNIPVQERIDCHPQHGPTQEKCEVKGCTWCATTVPNAPWCYYSADDQYEYTMVGSPKKTSKGWRVVLTKQSSKSLFGNDITPIVMDVEFHTKKRLRFKIYDPNSRRFEVPLHIESPSTEATDPDYGIEFKNEPFFHFQITRRSTGTVLWDTSLGGLTFANQFLQITTALPSSSIYGFGEHEHPNFKHDLNFVTYPMYSRDQPPEPFANLYGVQPFYMCLENDTNAHGVLFLNANAQEVLLKPSPSLTLRTIGGILDFYIFLGPTPESIVQQYTEAIGRPFLPPYWSLGFQLSRYGYKSLAKLKETVRRTRQYDIPHDVQYGDIDYMDQQMDFTIDQVNYAGLPDYVKELKKDGMHYIIILDPCLSMDQPPGTYKPYEVGQQLGIWVNNSDGVTPAAGKVWPPGSTVFPDYSNPKTADWWIQACVDFKDVLDYDGIWIDMNEPANFGTGQNTGCAANNLNYPPYMPKILGGNLADKTLCADSKTYAGDLYDTHSLYGWFQAEPTFYASQNATGKRAFVLTRSTFVGSGKWSGHWLGDNFSLWKDLRMSIIGMMEFNLFGIPYIGADICGFIHDTTRELCLRWMQLGAFYPFSRNHNGLDYKEQDPGSFDEEFAAISRSALRTRYTLLPYLYTLFYFAHVDGSTVVRPIMHEFASDHQTHEIDEAFLWGPALMITPVVYEGVTSVNVYFPEARWFNLYTGSEIPSSWRKTSASIPAPMDTIPLFIRGGHILPTQAPARTTTLSRKNPLGLIIALDEKGSAAGSLYWDEGDSIDPIEKGIYFLAEYRFNNGRLNTKVVKDGYRGVDALNYNSVQVFGLSSRPNAVAVNGSQMPSSDIDYQENGKLTLRISIPLKSELSIHFQ
ncbi:lysosomal alpha-glucosidase-like [Ambystoma mexicanum]|uniref:lysosomal alpha-glucosidase-like n=1 Tax=Ambystoma mexicanum TaxID=8296 RepID=UPI0037E88B5F